jgi:hypothetical protein
MSRKTTNQKQATTKPDQKQIQEALNLLSTLDADQAATVLANVKAPALTAALKAKKDADAKKQKEQEAAIKAAMERIGKILDESGIDRTVTFHRTEEGGWDHRFPKTRSGGGGGGGRKASLSDKMRTAIDEALNGGADPKPDKDTIKESGSIGAFLFGDIRIPTSLICYHLIENYEATTDKAIVDMVGSWGIRDTQARGALVRHKNK